MTTIPTGEYRHVTHAWDDRHASRLDPVERLVYRSNLLGSDQRITNTGGGNTSSKITEHHPLTGEEVEVLWVKGSGGDLRTAGRANFASLELDRVVGLRSIYEQAETRGVKTPIEDTMVGYYPHCTFNLNPRASSIDTPLHAFVPARHIDHMHPNSIIAIAAAKRSEALTREIFGGEIGWVPWQRPGFDLGLKLQEVYSREPSLKGVILGQHGVINWADDDRACYDLTVELIERAGRYIEEHDRGDETFGGPRYESLPVDDGRRVLVEILPWLRGRVSQHTRFIATVQTDERTQRFVNSVGAARLAELGTSCPDHFLRTKIKPMFVDWDPRRESTSQLRDKLESGLQQYRRDYQAYYERCRRPDSPPIRDPNPSVVLIPGVGMIAWGKNKSESRITAEFYTCAIEVMRGAEAIDEYIALPEQEAFDIEYWALEEAKLRRQPPEQAMARRIVVVVGAGHGIGEAAARRVADDGAHVLCADLDLDAATRVTDAIVDQRGFGSGVAGSGLSNCGPATGAAVDITRRDAVRTLFDQAVLAYGGVDHVVVTAGLYVAPDQQGRIGDEDWERTFAINVIGAYRVLDEAARIWRAQELHGSAVVTTSVNAVVAKRGSVAYDVSKSAASHLVREMAIELAPAIRVNGVAPATVVQGSTMFPRDRVIASLTKYGIEYTDDEPTEELRRRLADFYASRTLLQTPVSPHDQAEAIVFLLSDRASRTTGQILTVDGGLHEAFLR